jgi:hypothetical protein
VFNDVFQGLKVSSRARYAVEVTFKCGFDSFRVHRLNSRYFANLLFSDSLDLWNWELTDEKLGLKIGTNQGPVLGGFLNRSAAESVNFHRVPNQVLGAAVFAKQIEPGVLRTCFPSDQRG